MEMTHLDQTKMNGDLVEPESEIKVKPKYPEPKTKIERSIRDLQDAIEWFLHNKNMTRQRPMILHGARVGVLYKDKRTDRKWLLLFKREAYFMFGRHFPSAPQGHGIPCNMKIVHWCYVNDVTIAVIMGNGYCYSISGKKFWEFYEEYQTEIPHAPGEIAAPFSFFYREF